MDAEVTLDFYLSEMSISDRHGGGITLQRTLGDDLLEIERFVHVSAFALTFEPTARLRDRNVFFTSPFERESTKRLIGCRASALIHENSLVESWTARSMAHAISRLYSNRRTLKAFACPQSLRSIHILEWLKQRRDVRYITWMMDDHLVRYRGRGWIYPKGARTLLKQHLRGAQTVFVISPTLGDFYRAEFGVSTVTLFGPADITQPPVYDAPSQGNGVRIAYFGRVWRWQEEALRNFAQRLREGMDVLNVYALGEAVPESLRLRTVEVRPPIPETAVSSKMREYDAVLIPMSFGNEERHLTEFNIATKMSECIASGTVTIVYGPRSAAMVRYLRETGAACILTEFDFDWTAIAGKLKDVGYRRPILDAAHELVESKLSTAVMRERWRAAVRRLMAERKS